MATSNAPGSLSLPWRDLVPEHLRAIRPRSGLRPETRRAVFERDGYTCQDCGRKGMPGHSAESLQAHHVLASSIGGSDDLDNLITICLRCHRKRDHDQNVASLRAAARWWKEHPSGGREASLSCVRIGAILGVSHTTVLNWMKKGQLPAFRDIEHVREYAMSAGRQRTHPGRKS